MSSNELVVEASGVTDVGRKRKVNEDHFLIAELSKSMFVQETSLSEAVHQRLVGGPQGKLFVVADGMGGHEDGGVASSVAVDTVVNYVLNVMPWFFRLNESLEDDLMDELKAALQRCQQRVAHVAQGEWWHSRMGTTLTMAYVLWPRLYVVHAGDSRCYLARDEGLEQITKDHTVAQQLADEKVIPPEKADRTRWSNVLWNAIGGGKEELAPDVYRAELARGDTLLLCTDGLTRHVDDQALAERLAMPESSAATARDLVELANQKGGKDNITAVVARFS
jgi:protein phosphatase